jgi:tetratricopeptide (TPR) repeat protein
MERMLKYFIRTDKLVEVLPLKERFMSSNKTLISAATLAELGGYLIDKRFEVPKDVPDENLERINGIKDVLLRAVDSDPNLPESHYHLSRYYHNYGATLDERITLENAEITFDAARPETAKRAGYRVDALRRLAQLMIQAREIIPAEEKLAKGITIYEDAIDRRILSPAPLYGRLYADLGDIEYFAKVGNMPEAIRYYRQSEQNGWSPPELRYRLGAAYYNLSDFTQAQDEFWSVFTEIPNNRRILNAMGNVSYMQSNFFVAQGYYDKLLNLLETDRNRFSVLMPNDNPEHYELADRVMRTQNNLGVTLNMLAAQTGNPAYRERALALFAESARIWDLLARDPVTVERARISGTSLPAVSLPYLNIKYTLYPVSGSAGSLFMSIDKDVEEPSAWEEIMENVN